MFWISHIIVLACFIFINYRLNRLSYNFYSNPIKRFNVMMYESRLNLLKCEESFYNVRAAYITSYVLFIIATAIMQFTDSTAVYYILGIPNTILMLINLKMFSERKKEFANVSYYCITQLDIIPDENSYLHATLKAYQMKKNFSLLCSILFYVTLI